MLTVLHQSTILFDNTGIPRLAGFSNSLVAVDPYENTRESYGYTLRWAAPEILDAPGPASRRPTKMSDVYAFGMVVVEVQYHHHFRRRTL